MASKRVATMRRALGRAARVVEGINPDLAEKFRELQKPGRSGGRYPGAGRPGLFVGKRVKVSVKITEEAFALVQQERARLEPEWGEKATNAAAVESLIWKTSGRRGKIRKATTAL